MRVWLPVVYCWFSCTRIRRLSYSWARWIQLYLYLKFVLTFSHLHVGLPSGLLHVCPPEFCTHWSSLSYVQHAPPSSFSLIWHVTNGVWQEIQIVKVLCMQFFPTSSYSLLVPYIFPSTVFSNAVTLFSFLNMRDQLSHTCKTTRQNYTSVDVLRRQTGRQKIVDRMVVSVLRI
jgi:hypothetical protein